MIKCKKPEHFHAQVFAKLTAGFELSLSTVIHCLHRSRVECAINSETTFWQKKLIIASMQQNIFFIFKKILGNRFIGHVCEQAGIENVYLIFDIEIYHVMCAREFWVFFHILHPQCQSETKYEVSYCSLLIVFVTGRLLFP